MNESIFVLPFYACIAYTGKVYLSFIKVNTSRLLAKNKSLQNWLLLIVRIIRNSWINCREIAWSVETWSGLQV